MFQHVSADWLKNEPALYPMLLALYSHQPFSIKSFFCLYHTVCYFNLFGQLPVRFHIGFFVEVPTGIGRGFTSPTGTTRWAFNRYGPRALVDPSAPSMVWLLHTCIETLFCDESGYIFKFDPKLTHKNQSMSYCLVVHLYFLQALKQVESDGLKTSVSWIRIAGRWSLPT